MRPGRIDLNENWKFALGENEYGWFKKISESAENRYAAVTIPHDWSVKYPFSKDYSSGTGYVCGGIGWYRREFSLKLSENQRVFITFEGVYNNSEVWVNSQYLGMRPYGYSTFTYEITEFISRDGENTVAVKVDHSDIYDSRYFTGSGITRPVYLTVTGEVCLGDGGVFVTADEIDCDAHTAKLHVTTDLSGEGNITHTVLDLSGCKILHSDGDFSREISALHLWSDSDPYLYKLVTKVYGKNGELSDERETYFGVRDIKFDVDKGFFINGVSKKLKGVCLHHDAGCLGAAVPPKVWEKRLKKLKECGANAVRTSHNPPDPALLELCDKLGFYVMDEAFDEWELPKRKWVIGYNKWPPKLNGYYEHFPTWAEQDLKSMVIRDRNHPSIIMWSVGNEIDGENDPYVLNPHDDPSRNEWDRNYIKNGPDSARLAVVAKKLSAWVKECDTTRPVTVALAFPEGSVQTGLMQCLDVAGYNYKEHLYAAHHEKFAGHFIYGSENGHGVREWAAVRDNDYICGQFLWTGVDYLGEAQGWPIRVFGAGLLDTAGNDKFRFWHRAAMWNDEPCVKLLTASPGERWNFDPTWNYAEGERVKLRVPTNCDHVELYINGKLEAEADAEDYLAHFDDICFQYGTVTVKGYKNGAPAAVSEIKTYKAPAKIVAEEYKSELYSDNIHIFDVSLVDMDGTLCTRDSYIKVSTDGELLGIENGSISDNEPYTSSGRHMRMGRLTAYVRGGSFARFDSLSDGVSANVTELDK